MSIKSFIQRVVMHIRWKLDKLHFFDNWKDESVLKLAYWIYHFSIPDLSNPRSFNEKLLWLKINDHNPNYTNMVDKVEVKKYISEKIGSEFLIKTLGVYEKFDDINFSELPERFVIKCNHNSGGVVVCNNKEKLDFGALKKSFDNMINKNYYLSSREWPYKNVLPKIIIEENLQKEGEIAQINDYKLMCFNGKVRCSFVCSNRTKESLYVNFYDRDWSPMPFERHYHKNPIEIEKPSGYEKMVELAEKLSVGIPFVRVDFYQCNERIYFGELTFYPGGGIEEFHPDIWDYKLGEWLDLSAVSVRR